MQLETEFKDLYFPYDEVRPIQRDLILKIKQAVSSQENLIVHAPTGLGKTAAALAPAIREALKKDLTVFFLTSRHTQHKLAMETVRDIKQRYNLNFGCVDIIAKKWLCLQPDVSKLHPREFADYCKNLREDGLCDFYTSTRKDGEPTAKASDSVGILKARSITDTESIIEESSAKGLCPYELALALAKDSKVIIGDYYYIFHPRIREGFLKKIGKELGKIIVIIDEGHNLPERIKDLASSRITNLMVRRAIDEAHKHSKPSIAAFLKKIDQTLLGLGETPADERYVAREEFLEPIEEEHNIDEMVSEMELVATLVREEQKQSYIGAVSAFIEEWQGGDDGFARILSKSTSLKGEPIVTLGYRCLDPSLVSRDVIRGAYSTVLMSGTLNPTGMYKALLGFDSAIEASFKSPFPQSNRLNIIIPKTSTKYETRSESQYQEIADVLSKVNNKVPGNTAVFFPSYQFMEAVSPKFTKLSDKTVFIERAKFTKKEKTDFLESFKGYSKVGAVLLGVIGGNFSEGIDLPGDYLRAVTIVGLPLQRPDLETESLIKYYEGKFKKGWDYGYLLPAFNRALQSAGRCIRTEHDKGVIVFLDERYAWPNYLRCFPSDWELKVTLLYEKYMEEFFKAK